MGTWATILISAGIMILFFLCRKELRRYNKARLAWRIATSTIAVVCLVCMGLPLTCHQSTSGKNDEAIILTNGADKDSVQQFIKTENKNIPVYNADDILSTEQLNYDSVHVFGYGLSEDELASFHSSKIIFHPSSISAGITAINWNRQIKKGNALLIQGSYTNTASFPVTILLNGFNSTLDSVIVTPKHDQLFQLHNVPKQNGRAVYSVFVMHGKDTLEKETVPIEVITPAPVKVMILASSPDFENKFLKDWLSQNGYTVLTKTTISTNKYDKGSFNAGKTSLDKITTSLLDSFDVLISDEAALISLSKTEDENIYRQVDQKGMGLLLRTDSIAAPSSWYAHSFHLYTLPETQHTQLSIHLLNDEKNKIVLTGEQPSFIRSQNNIQPLIADSAGNMVAANTVEGSGKIILTTLNNTYRLLLAGNTANYYALWNRLLQKVTRLNYAATIETFPALPVIDQPVHISHSSDTDVLPMMQGNKNRAAFTQDQDLSYQWQATDWPIKTGWQTLATNGITYNWYVFEPNDWKYISATKKINANKLYSGNPGSYLTNEQVTPKAQPVPVPMIYFFLPFIICCGFLWMERKIS